MMRGSDSTTAKSSTRPPMIAGPISRNFRFFKAASCVDCAIIPRAKSSSSTKLGNDLPGFIRLLQMEVILAQTEGLRCHQCLDVRVHGRGESCQAVATFQHRHQPATRELVRYLQHDAR